MAPEQENKLDKVNQYPIETPETPETFVSKSIEPEDSSGEWIFQQAPAPTPPVPTPVPPVTNDDVGIAIFLSSGPPTQIYPSIKDAVSEPVKLISCITI